MTKRKPVLVFFIITAVFLIAGAVLFAVTTLFTKGTDLSVTFAELNSGILTAFTGTNMLVNIASIAGTVVLFVLIPLIVHLVRKQHSVTVLLLLGSLVALYVELLLVSYVEIKYPIFEALLKSPEQLSKFVQSALLFLIGVGLIGVSGIFELVTFIVDMVIRVKKEPQAVPTAQEMREEPKEEEPAPAPAEEPKAEEKVEEPAPEKEPEVVEEPAPVEEAKEEKKPEPQPTVININVVGVQPAEQPKKEEPKEEPKEEEKEEEEKPAPKKAPAKKAPAKKATPKKEEKKAPAKKEPAKKAEPKKAAPKKEEKKPATRATTTIKKPSETQTIKKAEILTNEEGKQFVKAYHISQRKELNKWQVKGAGSDKALKLFDTQKEAIEYANELSAKNGAAVRVHSRAGKMRKA